MWKLGNNDEERVFKLTKAVQKWLEFRSDEHNELDETAVQLAHDRSMRNAKEVIDRLELDDPNEAEYLTSWVQIAYFAGFLAGWQDHVKLLSARPPHAAWMMELDGFTREDWATSYAIKYARDATDDIFGKLLSPPVSPLVSNLEEVHLAFLKETHERSLFSGFLEGLEQAFKFKGHNLSTVTIDNIYEV
jgi:hypothetical protein